MNNRVYGYSRSRWANRGNASIESGGTRNTGGFFGEKGICFLISLPWPYLGIKSRYFRLHAFTSTYVRWISVEPHQFLIRSFSTTQCFSQTRMLDRFLRIIILLVRNFAVSIVLFVFNLWPTYTQMYRKYNSLSFSLPIQFYLHSKCFFLRNQQLKHKTQIKIIVK